MKKLFCMLFSLTILVSFGGCLEKDRANNGKKPINTKATTVNKEEKVLVYISGPEAMINKLEEEFEEERGNVCDMLKMSCGQVRSKVWTEQAAGEIQADVVWGSDPLIYNKLDDKGLLQRVELKDIDNIKEEYIVENRDYILVNERYITILYNKEKFKNLKIPAEYSDLTDKKYSNMLVMADATHSSTALGIASSFYQMNGENIKYFKDLHDNGTFLTKSNGQVTSKIMEGQFDLGIGPHDAVIRMMKKAKKEGYKMPVKTLWPEEGAIGIQRPLALIKDSSRSKEKEKIAKEFINFIVSKKAQRITNNFGFASVRKDIENKYVPKGKNVIKIDWRIASNNEDTLKKQYKEIFQD